MGGFSRFIRQQLIVTILTCFYQLSLCQTASDAKDLTTQMFTTNAYDNRIRPITNQTDQIRVEIDYVLLSVNAVDDVAETMKTTGYLSITWSDTFLVWVPANFGNLTYYHWPQNGIWKPDVTLKNSVLDYKQLGDKDLNVRIEHTGNVLWEPFQVFESKCPINIAHFPFDKQKCRLKFDAWSYSITEVYLQAGAQGLVLTKYERNSEWNIIGTDWYTVEESGEATVVFEITLQRKPLYHSLTLVFPIVILAIMNLFVFVLPSDCGEKSSYAVTIFLAMAVFMTMIESAFPANSETVAHFSVYVVIQVIQSTLITLIALVIVRCGSFDEKRQKPKLLVLLTAMINCTCTKTRISDNNVSHMGSSLDVNKGGVVEGRARDGTQVDRFDGDSTEHVCSWKSCANAIDKLCFAFFFCVFLVSSLVCLLIVKYE